MIEAFQERFKEDVIENISNLENDLLILEKNPHEKSLIDRVFRIMHSLKGSSAMFGFDKVGEYTHHLETIYDLIRDNRLTVSKLIIDLTLASLDHIKNLLNDPMLTDKQNQNTHRTNINKIIQLINEVNKAPTAIVWEDVTPVADRPLEAAKTYYILFTPFDSVFRRGINLLGLFEELYELGECRVFPDFSKLPTFTRLDYAKCYLSWEIIFATDKNISVIQDIFIFVDSEYEMQELAPTNLFINPDFVNYFSKPLKKTVHSATGLPVIDLTQFTSFFEVESQETEFSTDNKIEIAIPTQQQTTDFDYEKISSIRVASEKLDEYMNMVSELVTTQAELALLAEIETIPHLTNVAEKIEKITRKLRDNALNISLVPISALLVRFKRLVRDLSSDLNKEIIFLVEGTETELDKSIVENLSNPLLHILRNSVDHGIELPDVRIAKGKPRHGTILLKAFYSGTNVIVQITDDGAGINVKKVREVAIRKGFVSPETVLSEKELVNLIFFPGFTTTENVSEVSGRGVGMDVVKRRISEVRGDVEIETKTDAGTTITITLPLTLSIIDTLLVKLGNSQFMIPLDSVDNCYEIFHTELFTSSSNRVVLGGELIPFLYLRDEFGITGESLETERMVVVKYNNKHIAIVVDLIIGQHQAVLKPLGDIFKEQDIISGGSILGDGDIALVIDTNKLISKFGIKS